MVHKRAAGALLVMALIAGVGKGAGGATEVGMSEADDGVSSVVVRVRRFLPAQPLARAQRPALIEAVIENTTGAPVEVTPELGLPEGIRALRQEPEAALRVPSGGDGTVSWEIQADEACNADIQLELVVNGDTVARESLAMLFLPPVEMRKLDYIPEPEPVKTDILVGAHHCPLWEADRPNMWTQLIKHPERTPALGFYAQENPEVSDWETKWAVEHGISFFIYCWYRASQGEPVKMRFGSAIHDALFHSRFADKMKFTIMWENQARGVAGVADERDLMENLLPFWMENYFKYPGYLKVDNKPLLFVYRPEFLVDDLGSEENVVRAFDLMRQACRDEGFDGLYILGEYRGLDPKHLELMKRLGLDYTFAYCWHVPNSPTPEQAIAAQMDNIRKTQELGILPQVVTVSQAWSGWADEGSIWKIPPSEYEGLLRQAKEFIATLPPEQLGSRMLILDNWNEWGEGHYIAPYREYGFGYVDAVREVFADADEPHVDLIPEDIGLGPYDTAYQAHRERDEELRKQCAAEVTKPGASEEGLIAWWAFDEAPHTPVALDYSGHGLGGVVHDATRAPGIDGNALVCQGGCVKVPSHPRFSVQDALTIACWVKSDAADQGNTWFINRIYSGGTWTGYRMGVLGGKACFEVPVTQWSHHLAASEPLATGEWVHLAGTFDRHVMRLYVNGEECATLERPGPVKPNDFAICLGNFDKNHSAHFVGLLDEVKLYERALSPEEVREQCRGLLK